MSAWAWVIAQDHTLNGKPLTLYWGGGKPEPVTDIAVLSPFRTLDKGVATWPTKRAATAAFRKAGGRLGGDSRARAVELSDADAALVAPESRNIAGCHFNVYEARAFTDEIRADAEDLWEKIEIAYTGRAWAALGYATWDEYCTAEFGSLRLRLPREARRDAVCSLRESGMSIRAIASATGIDKNTVQSDLAQVSEIHTPEPIDVIDAEVVPEPKPIIGLDGKTYPPRELTPYQKERKARDEAEAALSPQERARRKKEADAFAHEIGDQLMAGFSVVFVDSVISGLDDVVECIRKLVEHGGVTSEQLSEIEAAHASYVAELDVLRMSERGPGAST